MTAGRRQRAGAPRSLAQRPAHDPIQRAGATAARSASTAAVQSLGPAGGFGVEPAPDFGVDQRLLERDVVVVERGEDIDAGAQCFRFVPAVALRDRLELRRQFEPVFLEPAVILLQPQHMLDQGDYSIVTPPIWIGLKNYQQLVQDPVFWQALT